MADFEILDAIKSLQTKLDSQTVTVHHTLQQYMVTMDSRLEDLCSQITGSLSIPTNEPSCPPPLQQRSDGLSSTHGSNPLLRTMKLEVLKFDGTDPKSWAFRINEYFDSVALLKLFISVSFLFISKVELPLGING